MSNSERGQKTSRADQIGKKYRILSLDEKQKIMKVLQYNCTLETLSLLSFQFNTSIKNLRRWHNEGIQRKPGCGRKKLNLEAEKKLCVWIVEQSVAQGKRVRRCQLKEQAIKFFNDRHFKASKAWQDEFIRNYDIKYQVNEILYKKGMLNPLQRQKFLEMKEKRYGANDQNNNPQNIGGEAQAPTETKIEETKQFCQTSDFCLDEFNQWFASQNFEVKFEESPRQFYQTPPQIECFQDDSWDYKISESHISPQVTFNNSKRHKKHQKSKKHY